jgi:hypothetical protein
VSSRLKEGRVQWPDPDSLGTSESALLILDAYHGTWNPLILIVTGGADDSERRPAARFLPRQLFAQQIQRVEIAPTRTRTWDQRIMRVRAQGAVPRTFLKRRPTRCPGFPPASRDSMALRRVSVELLR